MRPPKINDSTQLDRQIIDFDRRKQVALFNFLPAMRQVISRLSISNKISIGYAIALTIVVASTFTGLTIGNYYQQAANKQRMSIRKERKLLYNLRSASLEFEPVKEFAPYLQKPKEFQKAKTTAIERIAQVKILLSSLNSSVSTSSITSLKPLLVKYNGTFEQFAQYLQATLEKIDPANIEHEDVLKANELLANLANSDTSLKKDNFFNELALVIKTADKKEDEAEIAFAQAEIIRRGIIFISIIISIAIATYFIMYISKAIASPLKALTDVAQKATPELNVETPITKTDEVGLLTAYLNQLIHQVKTLLSKQKEAKIAVDIANNAKSEFLANMSHELRTPLNGILGYAQILENSKTLTEEEKHGIGIIRSCALNLLTLINDILDISKIEAHKMELRPTDFYLPSLLQGVVEICRLKAEEKNIEFIYQPAANLPTGVTADDKRLRQVLINLLGNAIKFTDNGKVTFQVEVIGNRESVMANRESVMGNRESGIGNRKEEFPTPNSPLPITHYPLPITHSPLPIPNSQFPIPKIKFKIQDTGVGMSPTQIEKIFLPFEQLGDSTHQTEGTGLGLAISQKIVELMGSSIKVKSQFGVGSVFEFEIEFLIPDNWTESNTITSGGRIIGYSGSRKKIMIVDDSWENRSVIVNLLEPLGFTIIEAANGEEGLEKASIYYPDLIISDLEMPIIDGWEMLKQLRINQKFKETIFILYYASIFDRNQQKSKVAGGDDFLAKPMQAAEIYRLLSKHLKLSWIYAETQKEKVRSHQPLSPGVSPKPQTTGEIIVPPVDDLVMLIEYAKKGQIKGIQKELEKIYKMDENYKPFVNHLNQLVKTFNIKKIRQFLQNYIN
ncbi:integral membrane sensor hybrid histidine kinase [Tolypothrix sp. NIES-4075]|uniref:ATP-binding protein n=1 Tax=Tolypothrix sp. NIES-4075 TaxID=2005459 RepID=UPI000B5C5DB6|nr:ATP-binding protein [Tolypothrix sp. NIES-4075]GAX42155.1 integral membrane sensor hybrid histidine kinase [Tolypothrix sp. NIES-4075]